MLARLTVKIPQMPRVLVGYWNSEKIIATIWTAYLIARRALALTCVVSGRISCQNVHHRSDRKGSE